MDCQAGCESATFQSKIKMNKKGITPIIAVILLLMMTVAAAGAAFYWLTKMQGQMQGGAEQYEEKSFERMASTVGIIAVNYNQTSEILGLYLQNVGTTTIPLANSTADPTTTMKLADADGTIICAEMVGTGNKCSSGCGGNLAPQAIQQLQLSLSGTNCDLTGQANETLIYVDLYLSGKATASANFRIKSNIA